MFFREEKEIKMIAFKKKPKSLKHKIITSFRNIF